jgi:hypothetical protein
VKQALNQDYTKLESATTVGEYKKDAQQLMADLARLKGSATYQDFENQAIEQAKRQKQNDYQHAQNQDWLLEPRVYNAIAPIQIRFVHHLELMNQPGSVMRESNHLVSPLRSLCGLIGFQRCYRQDNLRDCE